MERKAAVERKTAETEIFVSLNLDGTGESSVSTGIGFLDHMLTLFARHGLFDLEVRARGDLHVDSHHTVEDTGIAWDRPFQRPSAARRGYGATGRPSSPWTRR